MVLERAELACKAGLPVRQGYTAAIHRFGIRIKIVLFTQSILCGLRKSFFLSFLSVQGPKVPKLKYVFKCQKEKRKEARM